MSDLTNKHNLKINPALINKQQNFIIDSGQKFRAALIAEGTPVIDDFFQAYPEAAELNSQFSIFPGIIFGEQHLGEGQSLASRLYNYNAPSGTNHIHDITVTQMRDRIDFNINENDELQISCKDGAQTPDRADISGMGIWTMIFNIFDASGWLHAEQDISFGFINGDISSNTEFVLGSTYQGKMSTDSSFNTPLQDISSGNVTLSIINGNEITIIANSANHGFISNLSFNLNGSNIELDPDTVFIHITPAIAYDISHGSGSYNFDISLNEDLINSGEFSQDDLIHIKDISYTVGYIRPFGYHIQPNNDLGNPGGYYNINNLTYNITNLLTLSPIPQTFGRITR